MNSDKQFERYSRVQKTCDHTKHTETLGTTVCCFCTKLMTVICERLKIDRAAFSEMYRQWLWRQPEFIALMKKLKEELRV